MWLASDGRFYRNGRTSPVLEWWTMSPAPSRFRRPANPVTQAAFRRQVRREVYLPIGLTLLGIALMVAAAAVVGYGTASGWADTTLILLAAPTAILLAVLLAVMVGGSFLLIRLMREIPSFTSGLQQTVDRAAGAVQRGSDASLRPVIAPRAIAAALAQAGRGLRSLFRGERG
jgi:FtsH-binding integral membrane protein